MSVLNKPVDIVTTWMNVIACKGVVQLREEKTRGVKVSILHPKRKPFFLQGFQGLQHAMKRTLHSRDSIMDIRLSTMQRNAHTDVVLCEHIIKHFAYA